ncbi:hypothetical protein IWW54_000784 [Coemansia sp. RSA 2705]|nr:hypothetical protein IWW54_000784 [Coemansia sp. RSA 2705]
MSLMLVSYAVTENLYNLQLRMQSTVKQGLLGNVPVCVVLDKGVVCPGNSATFHIVIDLLPNSSSNGEDTLSVDEATESADAADDLCQLARAFEQTGPDKTLSWLELCTGFLDFCAQRSTSLALVVFSALNAELERKSLNIHVAVHRLDLGADSARAVLRSYYALWDAPDAQPLYQHAASNQQPALLFAESAQLLAIFGGQRGVGNCLEEAQQLLDVYGPLLRSYLSDSPS